MSEIKTIDDLIAALKLKIVDMNNGVYPEGHWSLELKTISTYIYSNAIKLAEELKSNEGKSMTKHTINIKSIDYLILFITARISEYRESKACAPADEEFYELCGKIDAYTEVLDKVNELKTKKLNIDYTNEIICPYCRYEYAHSDEIKQPIQSCSRCKNNFLQESHHQVTYSSKKLPCLNGESDHCYEVSGNCNNYLCIICGQYKNKEHIT